MMLALFRVIALDYAHSAQGFGQPACNLGSDLAALAKNGAYGLEGLFEHQRKHNQSADGYRCHDVADFYHPDKHDGGCQHSTRKLHQPGTDDVAHALYVAHDARNQDAALGGVVVT